MTGSVLFTHLMPTGNSVLFLLFKHSGKALLSQTDMVITTIVIITMTTIIIVTTIIIIVTMIIRVLILGYNN